MKKCISCLPTSALPSSFAKVPIITSGRATATVFLTFRSSGVMLWYMGQPETVWCISNRFVTWPHPSQPAVGHFLWTLVTVIFFNAYRSAVVFSLGLLSGDGGLSAPEVESEVFHRFLNICSCSEWVYVQHNSPKSALGPPFLTQFLTSCINFGKHTQ